MRNFDLNRYGQVDDYAYGGEPGMVLRPEPLRDAIEFASPQEGCAVIHTTPQGKPFDQLMAEEFSQKEHLLLICGHYKGIDERIVQKYVTHEVSLGDFVLTGGELAAMASSMRRSASNGRFGSCEAPKQIPSARATRLAPLHSTGSF